MGNAKINLAAWKHSEGWATEKRKPVVGTNRGHRAGARNARERLLKGKEWRLESPLGLTLEPRAEPRRHGAKQNLVPKHAVNW